MVEAIGASAAMGQLDGWAQGDDPRDTIHKSYKFSDFKLAWAFMNAVALKAEQMDHHPEWFNVYGTVDVTLTTHDADGVSTKDVELARYMDEVAQKL